MRYTRSAPSEGKLFADAKDAEARTRSRPQVAEALLLVIERFADHESIRGRTSSTSLVQIFRRQCEVVEGRVVVLAKTGGDVLQNPSDLEATSDGHGVEWRQGQGDQVPLSETCSAGNDVPLLTGVIPETACASDSQAVRPMLGPLAANGLTSAWIMDEDRADGGRHRVGLRRELRDRGVVRCGTDRSGAGPRSSSGSRGTDAR